MAKPGNRENTADVLVIGLGAMGSAALFELASRGLKVIGLERHYIGHPHGSAHGGSRVIRKAYAEEPRYVPLVLRAYQRWTELEMRTKPGLLKITSGRHMGSPQHRRIRHSRAAVAKHGLEIEELTSDEIRARFPAFHPEPSDIGLLEPDAGILAVEAAITAHVEVAVRHGADVRVGVCVETIDERDTGVEVVAKSGEVYRANKVVVCAGGYLAQRQPIDVGAPLEVSRQVQCWFAPVDPELVSGEQFPLFIHHCSLGEYYGLVDLHREEASPSLKACRHYGGPPTTMDTIDRTIHDRDIAEVREYLDRYIPAASGVSRGASVCLYTNTPDRHFVIGRSPASDRIFVAAGFSGHGFKFAPTIGEILADLAEHGETAHNIEMFDPGRFRSR